MNGVVTQTGPTIEGLEQVLIQGDLAKLSAEDRVRYYARTCESLGLNPLTKPFDYIHLSGRLVLYAKRDATDQLRRIYGVSIVRLEREVMGDVYAVTAYARDASGREDSSIGAVSIAGLRGEALANAYMKAETKAKRRLTLSICGLGMLDETEIETIPDARPPAAAAAPSEAFRARVDTAPQSPARPRREPRLDPRIPPVEAPLPSVTDRAVEAIAARAQAKGITEEAMVGLLDERYGAGSVWELSRDQAKDLYAHLGTLPDAPVDADGEPIEMEL